MLLPPVRRTLQQSPFDTLVAADELRDDDPADLVTRVLMRAADPRDRADRLRRAPRARGDARGPDLGRRRPGPLELRA